MKKFGFTAVEMLVTLGVIALISMISIPLLVNYQKTSKLRNEGRALSTNLRLAQQLAITEQNIYEVQFDKSVNRYSIINASDSETFKTVNLDSEVEINDITGLTDDKVSFNPTGGVTETGFIYLTNSKNQTTTVEIKPSGYVKLTEQ